jgi:DNA polymerase-3 subunit beta
MRATVKRNELLDAVSKAKLASSRKATLPILASVLVWAGGGQVIVTGSDLETTLSAGCKASVSRKGAVCVDPTPLEKFLKAVKEDSIIVSQVGKASLKLELAKGAYTVIEGFDAKDYPEVKAASGKPVTFTGLADAIKQVFYAVATEEARPVLNGIYFRPNGGNVHLVAADGFRLAETKVKCSGKIDEVIVPAATADLVRKLIPGKVLVTRSRGRITFRANGYIISGAEIVGKFPDYEQVIPKNGSPLTVDKKELKRALDIVSITAGNANPVKLFTKRGKLIVSTEDGESRTEVTVPAKGKTQIAFNIKYLADVLKMSSGDKFTLRTTVPSSPGCMRDNGTVHVLMPMFAQWE